MTFMKKLTISVMFMLAAGAAGIQAQSIENSSWKFYVDALHDTLTLHIAKDSSFVTTSMGDVVVRSAFKSVKDTLKMRDVAGEYACPDGEGVYRFTIEDDWLSFFLVADPCTGRSEAISGSKWKKVAIAAAK
jgi:hypothetical protein